ncbi:DMT family transporter [Afifella sp. JA880]|uniref:DMT family transporter n=1 Tax=Afifella sp. JA880 TaxID=2975280 RepID=UPI0021BB1A52|nr:DMT family transporter [Afifella sp. JA880]MCT8265684.1 DMT family transporter [Afifella sp. JA880]
MASLPSSLTNTPAEMVRGIMIFVAGGIIIPTMDALSKLLITQHGLSAGEVGAVRLFLQGVLILPLLLHWEGTAALRIPHLGLNLLRGACLGFGSLAFFAALRFLPLADAIAIFMIEPMIVTLLSGLFLGEKVGWRRIVAVLVGFAGALIIIQPSYAVFGLPALLPALTAFLVGVYFILSRHVARGASAFAMQFYAALGGFAVIVAAMIVCRPFGIEDLAFSWPASTLAWTLLLATGVIGTFAHLLFNRAYQLAPASVLAPFGYTEIVSAVALGLLVFGDLPNAPKWAGMAIVVGSGIFIYLREHRIARTTAKPPVTH